MSQTQCCAVMDLQWTPRVVDDQYADVYFCASCGHVHRTEKYAVSLRFPYHDRCVNCGGDLQLNPGIQLPQGEQPEPHQVRCSNCGLTSAEDKELHDKLAALHPTQDYMLASEALVESGRYVLALKLATAQTRWGADPVVGEVQRLAVLEAMNEFDRALDEAYEWSDNEGCPPVVYEVIAQLEAGVGNLRGALTALERGLAAEPGNSVWWADYAELNVELDERPQALRAAGKAVHDPKTEARCVAVLAEIGERYYAGRQHAEALGACSLAGDKQERYTSLAWLRARIAAVNQDTDYMIKWLEITIGLEPDHDEAIEMLAPYRKRGGWFSW